MLCIFVRGLRPVPIHFEMEAGATQPDFSKHRSKILVLVSLFIAFVCTLAFFPPVFFGSFSLVLYKEIKAFKESTCLITHTFIARPCENLCEGIPYRVEW